MIDYDGKNAAVPTGKSHLFNSDDLGSSQQHAMQAITALCIARRFPYSPRVIWGMHPFNKITVSARGVCSNMDTHMQIMGSVAVVNNNINI